MDHEFNPEKLEQSEQPSELINYDEDHPIYYDKTGRPLFGTSRPSAFAYAHPWPPTPTDINKKRVLRPKTTAPPACHELNCPRNSSDIELALYWDRSPKWDFTLPKYMTCPVHGPVPTKNSSHNSNPSRPNSQEAYAREKALEREMEMKGYVPPDLGHSYQETTPKMNMNPQDNYARQKELEQEIETTMKGYDPPDLGHSYQETTPKNNMNPQDNYARQKELEREMEMKGYVPPDLGHSYQETAPKMYSGYEETPPKMSNVYEESPPKLQANYNENNYQPECSTDGNSSGKKLDSTDGESHKNRSSDNESSLSKGGYNEKRDNYTYHQDVASGEHPKCASMTTQPVIVRKREGSGEKVIQVEDKDLKAVMNKTTYLCPLHGTYLNGVKRRNNPKFRTVVLNKDTGIQADLQIRTSNRYRECRHGKDREIGVPRRAEPFKVLGKNIYAGSGHSTSKKNKDEDVSEYKEHYKNPKKVEESKKVK